MFYIYADGKSIFQPMDNSLSLFTPKLTLEMGKAGALSFQIPPSNRYYNALPQLTTMITVEMDDVEIFRGRVLTNNRNFNNVRTVYCEGDLAYLVDTVQKAERYNGKTHDLFRKIIEAHNKRAGADKQFLVGDITIENRDVVLSGKSDEVQDEETGKYDYKQIAINSIADEWQNSFDFIQNCLIDYTGGYLRTRRQNGKTYIDLLLDYGNTATQDIEFGKNMLDLTEEVSAEDVFTVLIPLGDENLTIESVNNGSDELVDATAVKRYGRIVKTHVFDSVNTPETLLENGRRFLASNVNVPVTLTVKAVDMHLVDPNASPIYVGDKVHLISAAHGMADELVCTKIEYDLENPANNTYTFGTPKQSLTERYRKDKAKQDAEQTRGGGGGGGGAGEAASEEAKKQLDEFFDAWINVNPEAAHIDLGTLYKKFNDAKEILESSCGISLDAPTGNINIKTLRKEFDDMDQVQKEQAAYIDLLNNELGARISLVASQHQELANLEAGHYAEMTVSANDQESKIAANTESIRNLDGQIMESRTSITQLSNDLQAQIALEAEHKRTLDSQISTTKTSIQQVTDDLKAQIALEALECLLGNCESEPDRRKKWVDAVASIHWEGRMEEAAEHVLVDGAHNPGAIEAFVESIHLLYPEPEPLPIVVFSAVADKDYEWMIAYLCRYLPAKLYIVTEIPDKRRVSAEELKKVFERYTDCEVVAKSDIGDALTEAYDRRGESEIYCLGSLYLVGAIKERIAGGNNHAELR